MMPLKYLDRTRKQEVKRNSIKQEAQQQEDQELHQYQSPPQQAQQRKPLLFQEQLQVNQFK